MKGNYHMLNLDHIKSRIVEIDNFLASTSISIVDSEKAASDLLAIDFSAIPFDGEAFTALAAQAKPVQVTRERANLQATLNADLMHGHKTHILSNEKHLVSPAGFHPDTNVFVRTKNVIHTNDPYSRKYMRSGFYVHKMH